MADRKITDLTALAAGSQATGDLLTIVDVSESAAADKNKKMTMENLFKGIPGNVGVGETSPLGNLHVKSGDSGASSVGSAADELVLENSTDSGMTFLSGTTGFASINFADSGDANVGQILYSHGSNYLAIKTNDSERMRIDSSGNLGIGTSSPATLLHIAEATDTELRIEATGSSAGDDARLVLKTTNGSFTVQNDRSLGTSGALTFAGNTANNIVIDHNTGNVGIGTSSPSQKLHINDSSAAFTQYESGSFDGYVGQRSSGILEIAQAQAGNITFLTNGSERMRIDSSGKLLVGLSSYSASNSGVVIYNPGNDSGRIDVQKTQSGTLDSITNFHNGSYVGGLTYSNTATALVTSSDVRLKTGITDAPNATPVVNQIRIVSHRWLHDDAQVQYGVVAQELYQTVPDAVRVGDDGEEIEKTWGVDYSKLVPVLTKALQEAIAEIETLKTKVAALEAG